VGESFIKKLELIIHIDGASRGNPGPAAAGVEIKDADQKVVLTLSEYLGTTTNNVAEYFALLYALEEAAILKSNKLTIFTDSELLARQFSGQYKVKDPIIKLLNLQVKRLRKKFKACTVSHVPREKNREADRLANTALNELF